MSGKRQQIQHVLALEPPKWGEAPLGSSQGTEPPVAKPAPERPACAEQLMEEVFDRENLVRAWKRVRQNKGSPGIDGMTIDDARDYLAARPLASIGPAREKLPSGAMWFPRTAPPARRGTDPERNEKFRIRLPPAQSQERTVGGESGAAERPPVCDRSATDAGPAVGWWLDAVTSDYGLASKIYNGN
jgi:hypothetical protein